MAKQKLTRLTTPVGSVLWASLEKPSTKFKPDGEYSCKIRLSKEDGEAIEKQLKQMAEDVRASKGATDKKILKYELAYPVKSEVDEDDEETGAFVFNAKQAATIRPKNGEPFNTRIGVFDSGKNKLVGVKLGKDSKVRLAFDCVPYANPSTKKVGVSARLIAVQVIDLVEYSGGGADCFEETEGYRKEAAEDMEESEAESGDTACSGNF